jgi:transposase
VSLTGRRVPDLRPRIAALLAEGLTARTVAERLGVGISVVKRVQLAMRQADGARRQSP